MTRAIVTGAKTIYGLGSAPSLVPAGGALLSAGIVLLVASTLVVGLWPFSRSEVAKPRAVVPVLILCVTFPVALVLISSTFHFGALDSRLLSPILAPLVVLVGAALEQAWRRSNRVTAGKLLAGATAVMLTFSLLSTAVVSQRKAKNGHIHGMIKSADDLTANSDAWARMKVLAAARNIPPSDHQVLLSNLPELMTYSTGRLFEYLPEKGAGGLDTIDSLRERIDGGAAVYLVLVSAYHGGRYYSPEELRQWFKVQVWSSYDDGQVIQLS
jgi:hypothetical protein